MQNSDDKLCTNALLMVSRSGCETNCKWNCPVWSGSAPIRDPSINAKSTVLSRFNSIQRASN